MRLLLRPLLSFIVLTALVMAGLQGFGRAAALLLEHLEPMANQLLAGRGIEVAGLRGRWRHLNPVVEIDHIELPAGHLDGIYVEVDLVASLLAGHAVLFRGAVADAYLRLEKPDGAGWHLVGMTPGGGFDPLPLLRASDQLALRATLAFERPSQPVTRLALSYDGSNREGRERHRLVTRNLGGECTDTCELRVEVERDANLWPIEAGAMRVAVSAADFVVGPALLGVGTLEIGALKFGWLGAAEQGVGHVELDAHGLLSASGRAFTAEIDARLAGDDERYRGSTQRFALSVGDRELVVGPIGLGFADRRAVATLTELQVGPVLDLLANALAHNEVASRWLGELAIDANVSGLKAFYDLDSHELGYGLAFDRLDMAGYRGVPQVRGASGHLIGRTRLGTGQPQADVGNVVAVDIDSGATGIAFPEHLRDGWQLPFIRGRLEAFFRRQEFGFRAVNVSTEIDSAPVSGSVAVSRIGRKERDRRLSALAMIDQVTVPEARRFVPVNLSPRLYEWLMKTPIAGTLIAGQVAYQGQFRVGAGQRGRRLEIAADVHDGSIRFHPEWPVVDGFSGRLEVAGRDVRVSAAEASSVGADLAGSRFHLGDGGARAVLDLRASVDAGDALRYVRNSALARLMPFVAPDWSAQGPVQLEGTVGIPLRAREVDAEAAPESAGYGVGPDNALSVDLAVTFAGIALELPGYRLEFEGLEGPLRFGYPDQLTSPGIRGRLFDAAAAISVGSSSRRFQIDLDGVIRDQDFWHLLDVQPMELAAGAAPFHARLDVATPGAKGWAARPPELVLESELDGMSVRLPGRYAKPATRAEVARIVMRFPAGGRRYEFNYSDLNGWLRFSDQFEQGAIGLGIEPVAPEQDAREIAVQGSIDRLGLADLPAGGGAGLPLPVVVHDLAVAELGIGTFVVPAARIDARLERGGFAVDVASSVLTGSAHRAADTGAVGDAPIPIEVAISKLVLPAPEPRAAESETAPSELEPKPDPLSVDIIEGLPPLDVAIEQLNVGEADYGRWGFRLRREGDDLHLYDLAGRIRGIDVAGAEGRDLVWRGGTNVTTFTGRLDMANLVDVLPLWGYAPSVETSKTRLKGEMSWAGSPAAFDLLRLFGEVEVRARSGRFLDVESGGGAQRIMSLLNFTTIAKRMSLDFSDVFGKGLSFDDLKATVALAEGRLDLVKPLDVEGTGLKFRMTGSVDLRDRSLDHEMVVTLPVTRSLPWYAAYLGLANPIAGIGVLVGERVLRKPLEQFSSARYRITGTVENPELKLVSVFDSSASEAPVERPVETINGPVPSEPAAAPVEGSNEGAEEAP